MKPTKTVRMRDGRLIGWGPDLGEMTLTEALSEIQRINGPLRETTEPRWRLPKSGTSSDECEWNAALEQGVNLMTANYLDEDKIIEWRPALSSGFRDEISKAESAGYTPHFVSRASIVKDAVGYTWAMGNPADIKVRLILVKDVTPPKG